MKALNSSETCKGVGEGTTDYIAELLAVVDKNKRSQEDSVGGDEDIEGDKRRAGSNNSRAPAGEVTEETNQTVAETSGRPHTKRTNVSGR